MATVRFKTESPYVKREEREHDPSDLKYQKFLDTVSGSVSSRKPVTMALFGVGRAGGIHLGNLKAHSSINLRYVVESDQNKWDQIQSVCGSSTEIVHPDQAAEMLSDPELNACVICTPTFTHKDIILLCLEAGKAVFSEKPIGETPEDTRTCYMTAERVGKPLFCGFQRRYDPTFADIQTRVRRGEAGHIQIIKSISRDSPLPSLDYLKISGGIFHDCMVHDIDMQSWVLGELPVQVHTIANAQIPEIAEIGDYDNVVTTLTYPSGTLGIINVNRFAAYGYDQRLEVFGMKAMYEANNGKPNTAVYSTSSGSSSVPIYHSFPSRYEESYAAEMDHFVDVVNGTRELPITYLHSSAVSKIADAAEKSAREGVSVGLVWDKAEIPAGYFC
ncbi:inositol 2-dehydrogenase-like [Bolinopsis microptera]|uniref:inositol 2-dehydrogenase-like n=1 Tax=Bolinopsis microptera TaxID=2820187 RepID=UPI00307A78F6